MQGKSSTERKSTNTESDANDKYSQSDDVTEQVPQNVATKQIGLQSKPPKDQEAEAELPVDSLVKTQTRVIDIKADYRNSNLPVPENTSVQQLNYQQLAKHIVKISDMFSAIILRSIEEVVSHAILDSNQSVREKMEQIKKRLLQKYMHKLQEKQNKWLEVF